VPYNNDSILDSTKKSLGIQFDYTEFDPDVIMAINSAFGPLTQNGVGPDGGFQISDNLTLWSTYVTDVRYLGMVKMFIWQSARLVFDPPASGFGISAIQKNIDELLWRINVAAEQAALAAAEPVIWDVTSLSDFPGGAKTGDLGIDFGNGDAYSDTSEADGTGLWDLTGLSDFPAESVVGEGGIDLTTGDVYKRDS
jgi:hypothetical protein